MILINTTDDIEIVTTTTADLDITATYADMDNSTKAVTVGRQLSKSNTIATANVLDAPASGFSRKLKILNINNVHASSSQTFTIQYNANGTLYKIENWTIAAGERVSYLDGRGFRIFDALGREKQPDAALPSGNSMTSQLASFSADTYIPGANLNVYNRLQAGSFFRWYFVASKGAAGIATPTFIIRTGTAGALADTARLTMTGPAQSAAADTARIRVEATFRSIGASAVIKGDVQISHNLAATGFATTGPAGEAHFGGTSAAFDVSPANTIIGISINPGASGGWVLDQATLDAVNLIA